MVTGRRRRRGGGSAHEEATVTCTGSTALGYTDPYSRPEFRQLRNWLEITGGRRRLSSILRPHLHHPQTQAAASSGPIYTILRLRQQHPQGPIYTILRLRRQHPQAPSTPSSDSGGSILRPHLHHPQTQAAASSGPIYTILRLRQQHPQAHLHHPQTQAAASSGPIYTILSQTQAAASSGPSTPSSVRLRQQHPQGPSTPSSDSGSSILRAPSTPSSDSGSSILRAPSTPSSDSGSSILRPHLHHPQTQAAASSGPLGIVYEQDSQFLCYFEVSLNPKPKVNWLLTSAAPTPKHLSVTQASDPFLPGPGNLKSVPMAPGSHP
ncbi:hypothetical protein STEG23_023534 [Scotinomys teguina]